MKDDLPFQRRHLPDDVGRLLRQAREESGASRQVVADAVGIRARTLARIERGEQKPLWATLDRLCDHLGVSVFTVARRWAQESFDRPVDLEAAPGLGLRALRLARGMTLEQLADQSGISAATLSRYERGLTRSRLLAPPTNSLNLASKNHDVPNKMPDLASAFGFRTVADLTQACLMAYGE